jgi:hypothetical protein
MTPSVTLTLEPFARETVERYAKAGYPYRSLLRSAVAYYLGQDWGDRSPWPVPQFLDGPPAKGDRLRIDIDDGTWRALVDAAAAQGVSLESLAEHAVLFYVADLESGRVAKGLERTLADEE